jgi:hypothetical protein
MFQKYDERCEEHVRVAFRLPPLFLGKAADYNFATAVTAYQVAEAQVFEPERKEFDEIINATIMKALGIKRYEFKSKPVVLQNADMQMKALQEGKDKISDDEHINKLNSLSGLDMQHDPEVVDQRRQERMGVHPDQIEKQRADAEHQAKLKAGAVPASQSKRPGAGTGKASKGGNVTKKGDTDLNVLSDMVDEWMHVHSLDGTSPTEVSEDMRMEVVTKVDSLSQEDAAIFSALL